MLNQTSLKFILKFLFILVVAIVIWAVVIYFDSDAREEREALRYWEDLAEEYENDTFGGETPEETLALFIEALEAEDIELASMYFVIYERDKLKDYLSSINNNNNLGLFTNEIKFPYTKREFGNSEDSYIFDIYNVNDNTHIIVQFIESPNGVWKILDI